MSDIQDLVIVAIPQHVPEAIDVLVVGAITEEVAIAVAPMFVSALYPKRVQKGILHAEPANDGKGSWYVAVEVVP